MNYLGIDFGTSGARAIALNPQEQIVAQAKYTFPSKASENWPKNWQLALFTLLEFLPAKIREEIKAIAINGTSATVLLCNSVGNPILPPLLYNDNRAVEILPQLRKIAPPNHLVLSATSSLAKLLWWSQQPEYNQGSYLLHQADWLAYLLHGQLGISDYHNALKLGYDVEKLAYPSWLETLPCSPAILPRVFAPGTMVETVQKSIADRFSLPKDCVVCTGTTDSMAAFIASRAKLPGEAVTSLGSTLVLKLLSKIKIDNSNYGIYSHRFQPPQQQEVLWLTGGASNTGGAVLKHFFADAELSRLSEQIDGNEESKLAYYPLLQPGERFPMNDPYLVPRLEPRPENKGEFLHGLLESIARIEAKGYKLLQQLGATKLTRVYTAGGGANNHTWTQIRSRNLQIPITSALQTQAAFGTALLAKNILPPLVPPLGEMGK